MKTLTITLGFFACLLLSGLNGYSQQAKLIVYRDGCIYGSLAHFKVKIDGKEESTLKNKSFYTTTISAGKHTIAPRQDRRALEFTAEANHTYVVKYRTMIGILGARPRLKLMTEEEARQDSKFFREKVSHS